AAAKPWASEIAVRRPVKLPGPIVTATASGLYEAASRSSTGSVSISPGRPGVKAFHATAPSSPKTAMPARGPEASIARILKRIAWLLRSPASADAGRGAHPARHGLD